MTIDIVQRASSQNAPALVLLHAFPYSSKMWELMLPYLHEVDVTIVTTDLPGFGGNPAREWTMSGFAQDLHRSLVENGISRTVLCGLSMGGYLAFAYYRLYPNAITGLILADTKASADTEQAKADREKFAQDVLARGPIAAEEQQLAKMTSSSTKEDAPEIVEKIKSWMYETNPQGIANALRAMALREDSTDLLPSIAVPTLVMFGEEDVITSPEEMRSFAEKIPSATIASIPYAGHMSAVEQPRIFAEMIRGYLKGV